MRKSNPQQLSSYLVENMKSTKMEVAQLSCIMYKKMFLDQDNAKTLSFDDLEMMKTQIMGTLDFNNE
jgi:hypothetical protein